MIFFNLIMQMVQAFQEFNGPYIITQGGPLKSTYLLPLYIYDEAFKNFDMGYASAIAWVLFAIIMVLTLVAFWSSQALGLLRRRQAELTMAMMTDLRRFNDLQSCAPRPRADSWSRPRSATSCWPRRLRHALPADLAGRRVVQDQRRDLREPGFLPQQADRSTATSRAGRPRRPTPSRASSGTPS